MGIVGPGGFQSIVAARPLSPRASLYHILRTGASHGSGLRSRQGGGNTRFSWCIIASVQVGILIGRFVVQCSVGFPISSMA